MKREFKRGSVSPEEKERLGNLSIPNIRPEARYTPSLIKKVESLIMANPYQSNLTDNPIYVRISKRVRDTSVENPQERRPGLVDFLVLEAILPVRYNGLYNKTLRQAYELCGTYAWVEGRLLAENHVYYKKDGEEALRYVDEVPILPNGLNLDDASETDFKHKVKQEIAAHFWHEDPQNHPLFKNCWAKMDKEEFLLPSDILPVVAIHKGQYPTCMVRYILRHQDPLLLSFGSLSNAWEEYKKDEKLQVDIGIAHETIKNVDSHMEYVKEVEGRDRYLGFRLRGASESLLVEKARAERLVEFFRDGKVLELRGKDTRKEAEI